MSLAVDGFVTFLAGCIEYKFQVLLLHYPDILERAAKTHGADEAVMWCDYPALVGALRAKTLDSSTLRVPCRDYVFEWHIIFSCVRLQLH